MTVYSLIINRDKIGTINFGNLYDSLLSIGLKDGQLVMEPEKWRAIRDSVVGVSGVLAWVTC